MTRRKILLPEGSSLSARHTLFALGDHHDIDVADPQALCLGRFSKFCRRWFRCPSYSRDPEAYLRFLAERIEAEKYDVLLPTHEQVFILSRFRDVFSKHVGLALPDFAAMQRMQNKAEFSRVFHELHLPQPATEIVRTRADLESATTFPCFIKLAHSTAGRGVFRVADADELRTLADRLEAEGQFDGELETLIQQPGRGTQATVQAVFQHGRLIGSHILQAQAIGVGGMASARVGTSHPNVVEHVQLLGAYLNWHGAMFIDYFFDPEHGPQYLECNPRIGETFNATLSGVNLAELLVRISCGERLEPVGPAKLGVRSHSGFMILMWEALRGSSRRKILSEWVRIRGHRDFYQGSEDELTRPGDDWLSGLPGFAVGSQLLFSPQSAQSIVNRTVNAYCLPESAVAAIRNLTDEEVAGYFSVASSSTP